MVKILQNLSFIASRFSVPSSERPSQKNDAHMRGSTVFDISFGFLSSPIRAVTHFCQSQKPASIMAYHYLTLYATRASGDGRQLLHDSGGAGAVFSALHRGLLQ